MEGGDRSLQQCQSEGAPATSRGHRQVAQGAGKAERRAAKGSQASQAKGGPPLPDRMPCGTSSRLCASRVRSSCCSAAEAAAEAAGCSGDTAGAAMTWRSATRAA
jgi:hypothetical protein